MLSRFIFATSVASIAFVAVESTYAGPYAPAAGVAGSTAIHKDSASFVGWATGWTNYVVGQDVTANFQTPEKALGKAVGDSFDICVLGNSGQITLTFDTPIVDGAGADFAVFENGFSNNFLELGFVEVSSDGSNFVRFPVHSLTPSPVNAFGSVDPTNIDGFAGKYRQGYGTPFDLSLLSGAAGLDVSHVTHVRIVDVLGNGTEYDNSLPTPLPIYDPYKTTGSGGFDLDAVGVINVPEPTALAGLVLASVCLLRRQQKA